MLEVVGELAESDKVKSIIRSGESKSVEFKETLSLNIRNQTKDKIMEDVVIKTIAAFFNTNGGTLLIGIDDSGVIKGIDKELEKFYENKDKFLLHFKNLFKTRIGEEFYPYMENSLIVIDFKVVLYVSCQQSSSAVYVDGKDFYVRTNPATDKLEGPKLVAYINNHFKH
jgi:predicted HTH transcriptional regulator